MRLRLLVLTIFLLAAACGRSEAAGESVTPQASPTIEVSSPTPTSKAPSPVPTLEEPSPTPPLKEPSPTPTRKDPFLTVVDPYPVDGATGMPTETTIQFVLYRPLPVVRLSLSPEIAVEQVDFDQAERRDPSAGVGELYIFRPQSPLAPNTTYEISLEIGYIADASREDTVVHSWQFTTSDGSDENFASEVVLPLLPSIGEGGNAALLAGELSVEGRCLYIGESLFLPLFEEGTVWWEGDIFFHRGNRYEIGDTVPLGGGEAFDELSLYNFVQEPDESCDTQRAWVNIQ